MADDVPQMRAFTSGDNASTLIIDDLVNHVGKAL
jgi:hypothetical protein